MFLHTLVKLPRALVLLLPEQDALSNELLALILRGSFVQFCPYVVEEVIFSHFVHPPAGELQQRVEECVVRGEHVEVASGVLQVVGVDFEGELVSVGTQLAEPGGNVAKGIGLQLGISVLGVIAVVQKFSVVIIVEV